MEGLQAQGVVAAKRNKIRQDGEERPTRHIILTFERNTLLPSLKAGYINCRVRPNIPNPLRCFRCQRYGHGSRAFRGRKTCARCSGKDHPADACRANYKCANCDGDHTVYSRACAHFEKEKEILALKVKENISDQHAKRRLSAFQRGSFVEAVSSRGPAPSKASVATQVSFPDHGKPLQSPTPRLKISLPGHSLSAAKAADTPCGIPRTQVPLRRWKRLHRPFLLRRPPRQGSEPLALHLWGGLHRGSSTFHVQWMAQTGQWVGPVRRPPTQQGKAEAGGCPHGRLIALRLLAGLPRRLWMRRQLMLAPFLLQKLTWRRWSGRQQIENRRGKKQSFLQNDYAIPTPFLFLFL